MRRITYHGALVNQAKSESTIDQKWDHRTASITFAFGSGLLFILLGFFLQLFLIFSDRHDTALNYACVGSLVIAFMFFMVGAHFMDKFDDDKHRYRKTERKKSIEDSLSRRATSRARKINKLSGI